MGLQLLFWIILCYGITNIIVFGMIFDGLREFFNKWGSSGYPLSFLGRFIYGLVTCPMCFGTWVGFSLGLLLFSPTHEILSTSVYYSWVFDGFASSGAVWVINTIVEFFEENRINEKK